MRRKCSPLATVSADAGRRLPPAGISSRPAALPSHPRSHASRPGPSSGDALSTMAAAPSPKRMQVPRSVGSVTRDSVSAPITSTCSRLPAVSSDGADDELVHEPGAPGVEVERPAAQAETVADEGAGVGDELLGASRWRR